VENALLSINQLVTVFQAKGKSLPAVNGLSLKVGKREVLGIVGESGSGKSVTSLSVMRLVPRPGKIVKGEICFDGTELLRLNKKEMRQIRGKLISMIFQDPMAALDPVFKCGDQIVEAIRLHEKVSSKAALDKGIQLLKQVGIPHPERYINAYPYELSGGMCQRIMIVIALSCRPKLLIADEPTTALDVTVQAQILDLLNKFRKEMDMSVMLITHDLGVVAELADRVVVMYAGEVMEEGDVGSIFNHPTHPYTKGLLMSIPRLDQDDKRLYSIPGAVPNLDSMPEGCRFKPRCAEVCGDCKTGEPPMTRVSEEHWVRCWKWTETDGGNSK
jgi:oligopeptide/dipeptide ABC transporter ATP-binding protein